MALCVIYIEQLERESYSLFANEFSFSDVVQQTFLTENIVAFQ
jgi:hypothetical protein